jgi:hypothetical protein
MSYAPSQPASGSNGMLVLITLGVCAASFLELFAVIGGYILFQGGLFASRVAMVQRLEQQRIAQQSPAFRQPVIPTRSPSPSGYPTSPTTGPGTAYSSIAQVNVNDRVHILWGSSWYPGTVLQRQGVQAKIHYDNHTDSWDEFVGVDRLRRMSPSDPRYRANPSATASIPAPPQPTASSPTASPTNLNPRGLTAPYDSSQSAQDFETRDWKNRSGEVVFRGQLFANYGEVVRLVRRSGYSLNSIPVDLMLLSAEDQAYVRRFPVVSPDRASAPARPNSADSARAEFEKRRQEAMEEANKRIPSRRPSSPTPTPTPAADPLQGMRTWTDSTGIYKMEGELVGVENGNVQLKRPDGKISIMPLNKLSAADRELVRAKYPE